MTADERKVYLAAITGETDDDVLAAHLYIAEQKLLKLIFPYDGEAELPESYNYLLLEAAAYLLNKRGAEGETAHTDSSVTRTYETGDLPKSLVNQIVPYAGKV